MVPKSTATDTKWIMAAIDPVNSHGGLIDRALIIKISFLVCALCANVNDGVSDVRKRYQTPFLATAEAGGGEWDPGGAEWPTAESSGLRRRKAMSTSG